jgi:hypothetical protein
MRTHDAFGDAAHPYLRYMDLMRLILAIAAIVGVLLGPVAASAHMAGVSGGMDQASAAAAMTGMDMSSMADDHACCDDEATGVDPGHHNAPAGKSDAGDCGKTCAMACCGATAAPVAVFLSQQPVANLVRIDRPLGDALAAGRPPTSLERPPRVFA